jgi:hypothetical protein
MISFITIDLMNFIVNTEIENKKNPKNNFLF